MHNLLLYLRAFLAFMWLDWLARKFSGTQANLRSAIRHAAEQHHP